MALADYYLCDKCGCKTFYDANLSYDDDAVNPETGHPWPNGDIGYMIVLCKKCATQPKEPSHEP
jgi:hypothetical protein